MIGHPPPPPLGMGYLKHFHNALKIMKLHMYRLLGSPSMGQQVAAFLDKCLTFHLNVARLGGGGYLTPNHLVLNPSFDAPEHP